MTKFTATEEPPPGAGLKTVTGTGAPVALSEAGIVAVNLVESTNVVASALAPKLTTAPGTKFAPFMTSVAIADPPSACVGDKRVIVGIGLFTVTATEAVAEVPA